MSRHPGNAISRLAVQMHPSTLSEANNLVMYFLAVASPIPLLFLWAFGVDCGTSLIIVLIIVLSLADSVLVLFVFQPWSVIIVTCLSQITTTATLPEPAPKTR